MDMRVGDLDSGRTASAVELEVFALHMMGTADTLELMAETYSKQLLGVASEMAAQMRGRAAEALACARGETADTDNTDNTTN